MIARVRNPIDGWGGVPGSLTPSEAKRCTLPTLHDHVGQKARVCARPSWGVGGGDGGEYPHPCQVKSCHFRHLIAYVCQLPFNKA
jgi:hypothetical protein